MKTSTNRILTTHVGSMPRPTDLAGVLESQDKGEELDQVALEKMVSAAVIASVQNQVEDGTDIVSDGEMGKMSYHIYTKHRLTGLENRPGKGIPNRPTPLDILEVPEMAPKGQSGLGPSRLQSVVCAGDVTHADMAPLNRDIGNLHAAIENSKPGDAFMNGASPGVLVNYVPNMHYPDNDAYRDALVAAMRPEYEAIHAAGFVLQLDCPDLAGSRHTDQQDLSDDEFLAVAEKSIEALNAATANIPPDAMRLHICWLNYAGPHTHDILVSKLMKLLGKARPQALLFEGANPRHEHEWEDWKSPDLPDDKILGPGVIDTTSNFVEHPRLIAQRICRYADVVGRDRVIAGTDCGFGTYAGFPQVFPSVVRLKMQALTEGPGLHRKFYGAKNEGRFS